MSNIPTVTFNSHIIQGGRIDGDTVLSVTWPDNWTIEMCMPRVTATEYVVEALRELADEIEKRDK